MQLQVTENLGICPRTGFLVEQHQEQIFLLKSASACHLTATALVRVQLRSCCYQLVGLGASPRQSSPYMFIHLSLAFTQASLQTLEVSCDSIRNKQSQHIPNSSSCKMDISKFTFHYINIRTTRTREHTLWPSKWQFFSERYVEIHWIFIGKYTEYSLDWKTHHKGGFSSTARLSSSCHLLLCGKMPQILTATRGKIRLLKIHSSTPMGFFVPFVEQMARWGNTLWACFRDLTQMLFSKQISDDVGVIISRGDLGQKALHSNLFFIQYKCTQTRLTDKQQGG